MMEQAKVVSMNATGQTGGRPRQQSSLGGIDTGGSGDGGGGMLEKLEKRVDKLDAEVVAIGKDVAAIKATMATLATKEDMHKEMHAQTWRILGGIFVMTGLALTAVKLLF